MAEQDERRIDTTEQELFDAELRERAREMREQLRPSAEVLLQAAEAAKRAEGTVASHQTQQASLVFGNPDPSSAILSEVKDRTFLSGESLLSVPQNAAFVMGAPPETSPKPPRHQLPAKKRHPRRIAGILAAAAAIVVFAACGMVAVNTFGGAGGPFVASPSLQVTNTIATPKTYDEVYESLQARAAALSNSSISAFGEAIDSVMPRQEGDLLAESAAAPDVGAAAAETTAAPTDALSAAGSSGSYSETNTQVEGVDEADIIKTDGTCIYGIYGNELVIVRAAGSETAEIGRIYLEAMGFPQDMYVAGERLVVMFTKSGGFAYRDYYGSGSIAAAVYDIGNPAEPKLLNILGQDGYLNTSRLMDGILYLVSVHSVYVEASDQAEPRTFVPNTYEGLEDDQQDLTAVAKAMPADCIRIMPEYSSTSYTVLTAIDVEKAERLSELSLLGATSTVYMSKENLFLTEYLYGYGAQPIVPLAEDASSSDTAGAEVEEPSTRITRLTLNSGHPDVQATTTVSGTLLNQFSLDEYEGHLRVALTVTRADASDEGAASEEAMILPAPTATSNKLLVLNNALDAVGSIEDLAYGERIYSVRFTGAVGYMVTFRQTDPLFSLDLSDPSNPRVMDALKIPGFSEYLHPYAEGQLLGIGQDTTDTGGLTGNLKLSMFDTSNPFEVSEAFKELINAYASPALYNHKAVLIDEGKNIIGFSVESNHLIDGPGNDDHYEYASSYLIYGYDESRGFYERANIKLPTDEYHYFEVRALYIDSYLYLVYGEEIGIFDLETLAQKDWLKL